MLLKKKIISRAQGPTLSDNSQIVAPRTDGAAVMAGHHNGQGVRLKQLNVILYTMFQKDLTLQSHRQIRTDYLKKYKEHINSTYQFDSNSAAHA